MKSIPADYQPATDLLRDRVILITGAGDGIGATTARTFSAHGATVVLLGKTIPKLEVVYDAIVLAGHPQPAIYPMDLKGATPADYATLAETLDQEFGRLDGLVHNAATLGTLTPLSHYDDELWFEILQTNLNAPYLLTRNCLELLGRPDDASVLFMADSVGRHGKAYWGAYGVAKAGIENMAQLLADELEDNTGIRVNSYNPGPVRTALRLIAYPAENRNALAMPADVINPCIYLLGPDSRGITGQQFSARSG